MKAGKTMKAPNSMKAIKAMMKAVQTMKAVRTMKGKKAAAMKKAMKKIFNFYTEIKDDDSKKVFNKKHPIQQKFRRCGTYPPVDQSKCKHVRANVNMECNLGTETNHKSFPKTNLIFL